MFDSNVFRQWKSNHHNLWNAAQIMFLGSIFMVGFLGTIIVIWISGLPVGHTLARQLSWLFANNSTRTTWYITRSAGWIAYLLLWFSNVWGLAIPSKIFDRFLSGTFTFDFHEFISLLSIGFVALHVGILLVDSYLPFSLVQILVPFLSPYRPFWVGIGMLGFYLTLLVTITFYLRTRIGLKAFRAIHVLSLPAYLGVVLHGLFSGTDSSLASAKLLYFSTLMVVVFLTSYWLIIMAYNKNRRRLHPHPASVQA
jgi:predicted ferric reductase